MWTARTGWASSRQVESDYIERFKRLGDLVESQAGWTGERASLRRLNQQGWREAWEILRDDEEFRREHTPGRSPC